TNIWIIYSAADEKERMCQSQRLKNCVEQRVLRSRLRIVKSCKDYLVWVICRTMRFKYQPSLPSMEIARNVITCVIFNYNGPRRYGHSIGFIDIVEIWRCDNRGI